jgi:hypothetical protein
MDDNNLPAGDTPLFARGEGIEEIPMGDRMALYRSDLEKAIVLNRVGSILWRQFDRPQSRRTLVAYLRLAFPDVEEVVLRKDVDDYLATLHGRGIIGPVKE